MGMILSRSMSTWISWLWNSYFNKVVDQIEDFLTINELIVASKFPFSWITFKAMVFKGFEVAEFVINSLTFRFWENWTQPIYSETSFVTINEPSVFPRKVRPVLVFESHIDPYAGNFYKMWRGPLYSNTMASCTVQGKTVKRLDEFRSPGP